MSASHSDGAEGRGGARPRLVGVGVVSSVGAVDLHGDASLTLPDALHEDDAEDNEQCYAFDLSVMDIESAPFSLVPEKLIGKLNAIPLLKRLGPSPD